MKKSLVLALLAALAACTNGSGAAADLAGDYAGTWAGSTGGTGTLSATLEPSGDHDVVGTATFSGSPCFNAAELTLVVAGSDVSGTASAGGITAQLEGTFIDPDFSGSFSLTAAGVCSGASGTFEMSRAD